MQLTRCSRRKHISYIYIAAMSYFDKKLIYSGMSSSFTTFLFFAISSLSDHFINPSTATLIGVVISTFVNMFFQYKVLYPHGKKFSPALYYKYPIGHVIDISTTYLGCKFFFDRRAKFIKYLPEKLRPHFNIIVRFSIFCYYLVS